MPLYVCHLFNWKSSFLDWQVVAFADQGEIMIGANDFEICPELFGQRQRIGRGHAPCEHTERDEQR